MNKSNCEEIIGILWIILSLMLFDRGCVVLAKIALCMGIFAELCAIWYALCRVIVKQREQALEGKQDELLSK